MLQPTPYQNPFDLLGLDPAAGIDMATLKRGRKRLLAELELQDAALRKDKNQLLKLFDQLEQEPALSFHLLLHGSGSLRRFLETGDLVYFSIENQAAFASDLGINEAFREFLAPYFAHRFNQELYQAFKGQQWERLEVLGSSRPPLSAEHLPACYHDLGRHLLLRAEAAEELARHVGQGSSPGPEVQELCDEWLIAAFNYLPAYFDGLRNRYAQAMEALALALHNQHSRSGLAKYIVRQGLKLRLNEETRNRLTHILEQLLSFEPDGGMGDFQEATRQSFQKTFKKVKGWQIALGAIVGVNLLIWLLKAVLEFRV